MTGVLGDLAFLAAIIVAWAFVTGIVMAFLSWRDHRKRWRRLRADLEIQRRQMAMLQGNRQTTFDEWYDRHIVKPTYPPKDK